jgi:hypothetical protein
MEIVDYHWRVRGPGCRGAILRKPLEQKTQMLDRIAQVAEVELMDPQIARLFAAKEARRRRLARLPFAEKVRLVVQLQRMAAPLLRQRGRQVRVWSL